MRHVAYFALTSFALGCSDATSASQGQVSITTITCTQSVEDATSRTYAVSADGKAEGPVGSVVTLLFGKGTGLADPNHTSETWTATAYQWSFTNVPPTLTRTSGDASLTAVYVAFEVTQAKPVVAMPVYVRYHLTVPNGSTLDADKTTTCL